MSIPSSWCLIEDAAVALGCSTRTIRRRVAAGRLDARPGPDGRTLVRLPDEAAAPSSMLAAVQEQVESGRQLAAVMAMTHRDTLSRLQAAEEAIRRRSRWTWLAGSVAAASLTAAVLLSVTMTDRVRTADGQVVREAEQRQAAETARREAEAGRAEAERLTVMATADRDLVREQAGRLTDRLTAAEQERDRLLLDLDQARQEAAARRFGSMVDRLTRSSTGSPPVP
jgi:hypothetical protein